MSYNFHPTHAVKDISVFPSLQHHSDLYNEPIYTIIIGMSRCERCTLKQTANASIIEERIMFLMCRFFLPWSGFCDTASFNKRSTSRAGMSNSLYIMGRTSETPLSVSVKKFNYAFNRYLDIRKRSALSTTCVNSST